MSGLVLYVEREESVLLSASSASSGSSGSTSPVDEASGPSSLLGSDLLKNSLCSEESDDPDDLKAMIRQFVAREFQNIDDMERQRLFTNVLSVSSYRLPRSATNVCSEQERSRILKRCKRDWSTNESLWKQESREQATYTRCKVKRCNMTGFCEYEDTETGDPVAPEHYEILIMEFNVKNKAAKRLKRTHSDMSSSCQASYSSFSQPSDMGLDNGLDSNVGRPDDRLRPPSAISEGTPHEYDKCTQ